MIVLWSISLNTCTKAPKVITEMFCYWIVKCNLDIVHESFSFAIVLIYLRWFLSYMLVLCLL